MEKEKLGQYLVYLGGILAVLAGLSSIVYKVPLLTKLAGVTLCGCAAKILLVLGIIGLIGGIIALYGGYKKDFKLSIVGGVLGLVSPCVLPVLAIIGGYFLKK